MLSFTSASRVRLDVCFVVFVCLMLIGVTESLFCLCGFLFFYFVWGVANLRRGGGGGGWWCLEFSHHIYCAQ